MRREGKLKENTIMGNKINSGNQKAFINLRVMGLINETKYKRQQKDDLACSRFKKLYNELLNNLLIISCFALR